MMAQRDGRVHEPSVRDDTPEGDANVKGSVIMKRNKEVRERVHPRRNGGLPYRF